MQWLHQDLAFFLLFYRFHVWGQVHVPGGPGSGKGEGQCLKRKIGFPDKPFRYLPLSLGASKGLPRSKGDLGNGGLPLI